MAIPEFPSQGPDVSKPAPDYHIAAEFQGVTLKVLKDGTGIGGIMGIEIPSEQIGETCGIIGNTGDLIAVYHQGTHKCSIELDWRKGKQIKRRALKEILQAAEVQRNDRTLTTKQGENIGFIVFSRELSKKGYNVTPYPINQ